MTINLFPAERRLFVPEVVQTSAMDCGPAALKSLLEGFGISASYGRLREACQTNVDGTSIDTMEEVANQLGLEAEQIMVPADHLFLPESGILPAIAVVRQPDGLTHFVVVWNYYGRFVQLMDPASGRRWSIQRRFQNELFIHRFPIPAQAWRNWAASDTFRQGLRQRLFNLGLDEPEIEQILDTALEDAHWYPSAALDAATRMVDALVRVDGLTPGKEAGQVLQRFFERARIDPDNALSLIPPDYWSVQVLPPNPNDPEQEMVLLSGAVLVRVHGPRRTAASDEESVAEETLPLSPELAAALKESPSRSGLELFRLLRADGLLTPAALVIALAMATAGVMIEAFLFQGILAIGGLHLVEQRVAGMAGVLIFVLGLLLLELPIATTTLQIGRRLETRLRIAFLEKISRLSDRYFHSRLTSDMTQRAHELRQIRSLPNLGAASLRLTFQLILTGLGVFWLNPSSAPLALAATVTAAALSFITQPILVERDLRLRTHNGALSRFYLDALLGLVPIRTHHAERAVRREHESLLVEWMRAGLDFYRLDVIIQALNALVGSSFAVLILYHYLAQGGNLSGILLIFYWTLNLPVLGQSLVSSAQQYPYQRNTLLRIMEPLGAPDEAELQPPGGTTTPEQATLPTEPARGVTIAMENVTVQAGGHMIVSDVTLTIEAGEHVAIVGPSGAGKSSLVGLLMGWHRPAAGQVQVDGLPLGSQHLLALRRQTAWVDPAVQLWNRSLIKNLRYGIHEAVPISLDIAIEQADLFSVLEKLPDGLQTILGEGGGLVSGGEGQRVRFGRATLRPGVRLAILDESFRGLDRAKRRELLARAREYWADATLICITHDVGETQSFDRVLVIEEGRIVEDDAPASLAAQPNSRYLALLEAEEMVRVGFWASTNWRRLWLARGTLEEKPAQFSESQDQPDRLQTPE
jgi:ATP-binding cassette subfamily B protein